MIWKWSELKRLLKGKDDFSKSAVVVWPVVGLDEVEEAHVTVIYLGDINEGNFSQQEVLEAMTETHFDNESMVLARVTGLEYFGPNKDIPVFRIDHTRVQSYQEELTAALAKRGIRSASEFPEYKAHITVNDELAQDYIERGSAYADSYYMLSAPELWWGNVHIRA